MGSTSLTSVQPKTDRTSFLFHDEVRSACLPFFNFMYNARAQLVFFVGSPTSSCTPFDRANWLCVWEKNKQNISSQHQNNKKRKLRTDVGRLGRKCPVR